MNEDQSATISETEFLRMHLLNFSTSNLLNSYLHPPLTSDF
jgi:hypothetical protein